MAKVIRPFCWHQNFVPWGLSALSRSYIHILNHEKNCIKSDFKDIFFKLATNEWSGKTFLLTSKLCPLGAVFPCPGAIYMCKIMKKLYKIRLQRDFFWNLQQMTKVTRCSCWHQNFVPKGLSAPAPGLYICIKLWNKMHNIRLQRDFFFKLVANDQSDKRFLLTSKFCPLGLSVPDLWLYTFIKSWKDVYKVRGWRDSF